jgi:hypothetical protein
MGNIAINDISSVCNLNDGLYEKLWILEFPTAAYSQLWPPVGSPTA